jgi:hypothetical protein
MVKYNPSAMAPRTARSPIFPIIIVQYQNDEQDSADNQIPGTGLGILRGGQSITSHFSTTIAIEIRKKV